MVKAINALLEKKGVSGTGYLFGGNSLISQDIISRATDDLDLFLLIENKEMVPEIKETIQRDFKTVIDIGIDGRFDVPGKGFTWQLPKSAYTRAKHITSFPNLKVFALHPLDIVALKVIC